MEFTDELIEELQKKYNRTLFDNFYSTEKLVEVVTASGIITKELGQLKLKTGIVEGATAKAYYDLNIFNPHYSKAYFRLNVDSLKDVFLWVGFKKNFSDPAYNDVESHSALMISNHSGVPRLYLSTGNELGVVAGYQNTEISGIDLTRDYIFKIEKNKISFMPLPQIIPYMDTFRIISPSRVWTLKVTNSTSPPEDQVHYIMFFISNTTNTNRVVTIKHFNYLEEFAD